MTTRCILPTSRLQYYDSSRTTGASALNNVLGFTSIPHHNMVSSKVRAKIVWSKAYLGWLRRRQHHIGTLNTWCYPLVSDVTCVCPYRAIRGRVCLLTRICLLVRSYEGGTRGLFAYRQGSKSDHFIRGTSMCPSQGVTHLSSEDSTILEHVSM